jgi:Holliday junction resolvase
MANSDRKGKAGERELCRKLREKGFGAIRSAQVTGAKDHSDSSDIITSLDREIRFEVKRGYEDASITSKKFDQWRLKAVNETPPEKYPVLAWRKNRQPWVFFVLARGEHCRARMMVGIDAFVDALYMMVSPRLSEYRVDDPSTWKTTDTFS